MRPFNRFLVMSLVSFFGLQSAVFARGSAGFGNLPGELILKFLAEADSLESFRSFTLVNKRYRQILKRDPNLFELIKSALETREFLKSASIHYRLRYYFELCYFISELEEAYELNPSDSIRLVLSCIRGLRDAIGSDLFKKGQAAVIPDGFEPNHYWEHLKTAKISEEGQLQILEWAGEKKQLVLQKLAQNPYLTPKALEKLKSQMTESINTDDSGFENRYPKVLEWESKVSHFISRASRASDLDQIKHIWDEFVSSNVPEDLFAVSHYEHLLIDMNAGAFLERLSRLPIFNYSTGIHPFFETFYELLFHNVKINAHLIGVSWEQLGRSSNPNHPALLTIRLLARLSLHDPNRMQALIQIFSPCRDNISKIKLWGALIPFLTVDQRQDLLVEVKKELWKYWPVDTHVELLARLVAFPPVSPPAVIPSDVEVRDQKRTVEDTQLESIENLDTRPSKARREEKE